MICSEKLRKKMNFSFVLVVVAICLTDVCNGQFKILGLLDTKSENNSGKVENIRSLDEVPESFPSHSEAVELSGVTETTNGSEQLDAGKENVNFIKPYEAVTNEWKQDFVQLPSDTGASLNENITKVLESDETNRESVSGKDVTSETVSDGDIAASMFESTTSTSTTTIATKAYRSECEIIGHYELVLVCNKQAQALKKSALYFLWTELIK